jgi:hypothetical protein
VVRDVSPDATIDEATNTLYYKTEIEIDGAELRELKDVKLISGNAGRSIHKTSAAGRCSSTCCSRCLTVSPGISRTIAQGFVDPRWQPEGDLVKTSPCLAERPAS